ncbi:hypothetical protein UCRNP2_7129 [Neofusicoccum parvum UCRNP2]|uniref:Uncharacterized protein n=1 Tax=Botryosphaeria parva (strain UCR-NP2) TaxID=1287680 RepID=R1EEF9_BOTPV|nr:hypothetical protein UCRNP2_7129 [Neofusicoccum parvum UCRNP2]
MAGFHIPKRSGPYRAYSHSRSPARDRRSRRDDRTDSRAHSPARSTHDGRVLYDPDSHDLFAPLGGPLSIRGAASRSTHRADDRPSYQGSSHAPYETASGAFNRSATASNPVPVGPRHRPLSPAPRGRSISPGPRRRDRSPSPYRRELFPDRGRADRSPSPYRRSLFPGRGRANRSPTPHRADRVLSHYRPAWSPTSHRKFYPSPHRRVSRSPPTAIRCRPSALSPRRAGRSPAPQSAVRGGGEPVPAEEKPDPKVERLAAGVASAKRVASLIAEKRAKVLAIEAFRRRNWKKGGQEGQVEGDKKAKGLAEGDKKQAEGQVEGQEEVQAGGDQKQADGDKKQAEEVEME